MFGFSQLWYYRNRHDHCHATPFEDLENIIRDATRHHRGLIAVGYTMKLTVSKNPDSNVQAIPAAMLSQNM